jgi:hypothetical protein
MTWTGWNRAIGAVGIFILAMVLFVAMSGKKEAHQAKEETPQDPRMTAWYMAKESVKRGLATTARPDFGGQTFEAGVKVAGENQYLAEGWVEVDTAQGLRARRGWIVVVVHDVAKEEWRALPATWK